MRTWMVRDVRTLVVNVEGTERCGQQDITRRSEVYLHDAKLLQLRRITELENGIRESNLLE